MKIFKTLTLMQLRDKIDLSWTKNLAKAIRTIVLAILKFVIVVAITYILLLLSNRLGIFTYDESPIIVILVLTISLALSFISCTYELMQTLYFAEDNKVLITLPANTNVLFISKIAVFFLYELKKSFSFFIPITLGCAILLVNNGMCGPIIFLWLIIPTILIVSLPVLLGSLVSIPLMFVYRFIKDKNIIKAILFICVLALAIFVVVKLIGKIPDKIDLINMWPLTIKPAINNFLISSEKHLFLMSKLIYIIIGDKQTDLTYAYTKMTFLYFGILTAVVLVLVLLTYFISRPIFFGMLSKSFEMNKNKTTKRPNKIHKKYMTFVNKEFIIQLRTVSISINYLIIYIIVPILVLLLNELFKAMDPSNEGLNMMYAFNILLILLPFLASNALVATYYSKEGRAGYLKKTKPIEAFYPLLAKLFFNVIFSIPAVFVTIAIFGNFANNFANNFAKLNTITLIILGIGILSIHLGHMIYSATLDIMNPQNEQYATTGTNIDNPNENKSTIVAFVLSFVLAIVSFMFLQEATANGNVMVGFYKLAIIGVVYLGCMILMFFKRIKAFYYDTQGN